MGCDIHTFIDKQNADGTWSSIELQFPDEYDQRGYTTAPFEWRNYSVFAFLAGVRNYSAVPPLSEPRGFPDDVEWDRPVEYGYGFTAWNNPQPYNYSPGDDHNPSWYLLSELLDFDYSQQFEDRRIDGGNTAPIGQGEMVTYKEFLPDLYFRDLDIMKQYCDATGLAYNQLRIVFYFDN